MKATKKASCSWKALWFAFVILAALLGGLMFVSALKEPYYAYGVMALVFPLLITLVWLIIQAIRQRKKINVIQVVLFIIVSIVMSYSGWMINSFRKSQQPFISFAKNACLGKPISNAAQYISDSSFHPIILLDQNGDENSWSDDSYLWRWQSNVPQDLQLVACIEEKRIGLGTCHYSNGGVINQYQKTIHVRVISIHTGMLITEKDIFGPVPSPCSDQINNSGGDEDGGAVSENEVKAQLIKYVNPPQTEASQTEMPILDESILFQPGDLPAGTTMGDVNNPQDKPLNDMPKAIYQLYTSFNKGNDLSAGSILISLYGSQPDAENGYDSAIQQFNDENWIEGKDNGGNPSWFVSDVIKSLENGVGEKRMLGIEGAPSNTNNTENILFERCNAIIQINYIADSPTDVVTEQIIAYAKNIDKRISNALCK